MNALPSDLQEFIDAEIANRAYSTREELIADAVRHLRSRKEQIERLRGELDQARNELDRGQGIEIDDDAALRAFIEDVRARGHARHNASGRVR